MISTGISGTARQGTWPNSANVKRVKTLERAAPPRDRALRVVPYFFVTPQNTVTCGSTAGKVTLSRAANTPYHSPSGKWVTTFMA